jgi:hypothetical protein
VEVSVETGVPLQHLSALDWTDLETYLDVIKDRAKKAGGRR